MRAVLPVHLYGHLADCVKLAEIAQRGGAALVEDAAQAIGASRCGVQVGQYGNATCFSFYPTKNLGAIGDAGAIVTPDAAIAARAKIIRNYGQGEKYVHSELGLNSRLDELHAALLEEVFLPRLAGWNERRRQIASRYLERWSSTRVQPVARAAWGSREWQPSWHLFPAVVPVEEKESLLRWLRENGILAGEHYPILIPDQAGLTGVNSVCFGNLERARSLAAMEVSLPIHPHMTDGEVDRVLAAIGSWPVK